MSGAKSKKPSEADGLVASLRLMGDYAQQIALRKIADDFGEGFARHVKESPFKPTPQQNSQEYR